MVVNAKLATNAGSSFKAAGPRGSKSSMMVADTTCIASATAVANPMVVRVKALVTNPRFNMNARLRNAKEARTRARKTEPINSFHSILYVTT